MKTQILIAAALAATVTACSSSPEQETVEVQDASQSQTLASTVAESGRFEVLSSAFAGAGVASILQDGGPYTIFVVADDDLTQNTLAGLTAQGGLDELDTVARFHVVPGLYISTDLEDEATVSTLTGQRLRLSNWNGSIEVQSFGTDTYGLTPARVIEADIECDNGVMHVIDQPLVPSFESLGDHLESAGIFSQLQAAARRAGVDYLFDSEGPYTLFAPTNDAIAALGADNLAALMSDRQALAKILADHVVEGRIYADTLHHQPLTTLGGNTLQVDWSRGRAFIGEVEIIATDFEATNGVVHAVDGIVQPD